MRPLLTQSARFVALATLLVLAVGVGAGVVRLLPWLVAPDVPVALAIPFAVRLGRSAFDAAVLIGLPVGVGVASALFVESGQARSLLSLGASPSRLVRSVAGLALLVVTIHAAASISGFRESSRDPGRFAAALIDAGRAACGEAGGNGRVDIPIVRAAWLCFSKRPLLAGRVPGLHADIVFSATNVRLSDDLSSATLDGVHIAGRVGDRGSIFRTSAARARVSGLLPAGRLGWRSGGVGRALVGSGSAALVALALAWIVVRGSIENATLAASAGGSAALTMLFVLRALEGRAGAPGFYALVPLAGISAVLVTLGAAGVTVRFFPPRVARRASE